MMTLKWNTWEKSKPENATSPPMRVHRVRGLNCLQKSKNKSMIVIFGMSFANLLSEALLTLIL